MIRFVGPIICGVIASGGFAKRLASKVGWLTQEDLAQILFCDFRTIRRNLQALKEEGIHIPSRGSQKDIRPILTHKAVDIRHWLEGKEPQEVVRAINHSLRAVEQYLNHCARIINCLRHGFGVLQTAFAQRHIQSLGANLPRPLWRVEKQGGLQTLISRAGSHWSSAPRKW